MSAPRSFTLAFDSADGPFPHLAQIAFTLRGLIGVPGTLHLRDGDMVNVEILDADEGSTQVRYLGEQDIIFAPIEYVEGFTVS